MLEEAALTQKNAVSTSANVSSRRPDIPGWGVDLDRANRPAYPMERTPPRLPNGAVGQPEQQHSHVEVLHSIERTGLTPIFGTTLPPKGLNGHMRRYAFRYSENDLRHWLLLLAADRVQVGETLISDLAHGQIPNLYKEMGGPAEVKYNPAGAARKAAVLGLGMLIVGIYMARSSRQKTSER